MQGGTDQRCGEQAAERALQRAEIVEGAADEGIGRADHARHLDFGGLRHDLQTDGVEGHGDQSGSEDPGQHPQRKPGEPEEGIEALDPGRVELHMGNLGPAGDFLAQDFEGFRRGIGGLDDEGVGQRIARQAGDDFGHALARLHALQRLLAGHETPLAGCRLAQPVLDLADFLLAGIEVHEQADLLDTGNIAAKLAQVVEQHVAEGREGQGDADHQQRQQGVERRRPQAAESRTERRAVLGEPGVHCSLP